MRIEREILQLIDKEPTISTDDNELECSYPIIKNFKEKSSTPDTIFIHAQIKLEPVLEQQSIWMEQSQYDLYSNNLCNQLSNVSDIPYVATYKSIALMHNKHFEGGENFQFKTDLGGNTLFSRVFFTVERPFEYSTKNPIIAYGGSLSSEPLLSIEQSAFWVTVKHKAVIRKISQMTNNSLVYITEHGISRPANDLQQLPVSAVISSGDIKVFVGDIVYKSRNYEYIYRDLVRIEFSRSIRQ